MRKLIFATLVATVLPLVPTGAVRADAVVTITRVGNPTWTPVDIHLFSAPAEPFATVGTATAAAILTPHFNVVGGVIIPNPPDPGPYTNQIATGLANLGIKDRSVFQTSDLAGTPNGIWLAYMLVPASGSPTGSSPDFASGPIIPESRFPIIATEEVTRNGLHYDSGTVTTRALAALTPPFIGFGGSSHRPQLLETDNLFADNPGSQNLAGHYLFISHLRDAQGNGFDVVAAFDVTVPEPSSLALLAVGGFGLAVFQRLRKGKRAQA